MDALNQIVLISAFRSELQDELNQMRHELMRERLAAEGLAFRELHGVYDGIEEKSFCVVVQFPHNQTIMDTLRDEFQQEAYLYSDSRRHSTLHFADGRVSQQGRLRAIDKHQAMNLPAYSFDDNSNYWGIV